MLTCFLLFLIALVTATISFWYCRYFYYHRRLKHFPEIKGYPLIGSLLELMPPSENYRIIKDKRNEKGNTVWAMGGFDAFMFTGDPKLAKVILSSTIHISKPKIYDFLHVYLEQGLITSTGEKWKMRRKIIEPAFHFKILEQYSHTFNNATEVLVKQLSKEVTNSSVDVGPYVSLCLLDMLCESTMGTSVDAQINKDSKLCRCLGTITRILVEKMINPVKNNSVTYYFTQNYRTEKECVKYYHDYSTSIIRQRRLAIHNSVDLAPPKKMAFLDLLLSYSKNGETLSDDDIREEVNTFMGAGHDTMSTATSCALFLLANNPEVQQTALKEIIDVLGEDTNRAVTFSDLQRMKFLELVIKETLRIYPSVPLIGRRLVEDLEYEGKTLPKGLTVIVGIYLMHEDLYRGDDGKKFNPDRFRHQTDEPVDPFAFVPFSAGPRNCIGQKYAFLAMKSVISKVLLNFELVAVTHELDLSIDIVLKSLNGYVIGLKKRT